MYCENCGEEISDEVKFCNHCGHEIRKTPDNNSIEEKTINDTSDEIQTSDKPEKVSKDTKTKNINSKYLIIGIAAVLLIVVVGVFVFGNNGPGADGTVVLSDTCSIKTIGEDVEVKNNKACWTIENENYTIFYGNYDENTDQYNTVTDLISFCSGGDSDTYLGGYRCEGKYNGRYVIGIDNVNEAILIQAKDKKMAKELEDNLELK